jgi:hypothetical protein
VGTVLDIKLIRTDTTLDLSQKAEKVCFDEGSVGFYGFWWGCVLVGFEIVRKKPTAIFYALFTSIAFLKYRNAEP